MCPVALVGEMDLIWAWVMYASKVYSQPSLGGCRDRDEKAGARARGDLRLLLCSLARFTVLPYCGKFLKRWEYQTTLLTSWETCMQVKKQLDMEQQTSSKLGKEYIKALYCHSPYLTCMQSTSCKIPGWMNEWIDKSQVESRLLGEISMTSDMQMTPPLWQKVPPK